MLNGQWSALDTVHSIYLTFIGYLLRSRGDYHPRQSLERMEEDTNAVIIAVDIGSSSIRCSAYRAQDRSVVATSSRKVRCVEPQSGNVILEGLLETIDECVDHVLNQLESDMWVRAVGFASFVMNLVAVDCDGKLVGSKATVTYACSTDLVAKEVEKLKSTLGDQKALELYQKTGAPIHSAYAIAQLRSLYSTSSFVKDIKQWQTLPSICMARWSGHSYLPISYSEASWTGLLNYSTCAYEKSALDLLSEECRLALPELSDFDELSDVRITASYLERWPKLGEARLFLGLGDGACANIGSKCSSVDRIACTVGTSAAARVCLSSPIGESDSSRITVEHGLFCYRIDRTHLLVGGALTDGGSVVEWARQLLNLRSDNEFAECMVNVKSLVEKESSTSTPTMVPFLSGERSTGFRTRATGALLGLTRDTTPAHLLKSSLEGVSLRLAAVIELIQKAVVEAQSPQIIASGKALEVNAVWRQMIADSTGLTVVFDSDTQEGTSRGIVCMISHALKSAKGSSIALDEEPIRSEVFAIPKESSRGYWRQIRTSQDELIGALSPLFSD